MFVSVISRLLLFTNCLLPGQPADHGTYNDCGAVAGALGMLTNIHVTCSLEEVRQHYFTEQVPRVIHLVNL